MSNLPQNRVGESPLTHGNDLNARRFRMKRGKFDDQAKEIFLQEYEQHGRMQTAAAQAGVTPQTVRAHMEKNEEFAEMVAQANDAYRDRVVGHHQSLIFEGQQKEHYDKNGNITSTETVYPIKLIELELKKVDSGYRDKQEISHNHSGGVLVAPAEVNSVDEWEKKWGANKEIEGTAEDVTENR